jgi:two-component system sensor histidine kinase GlrK
MDTSASAPSGLSLRAMVGGGAVIVALCLGLAASYAIGSLQLLAGQSERLLASGVDTTRLIEQLADRITDVERTARQFAVVGSPNLAQVYRDRRQALLTTMDALTARDDVPAVAPALQELRVLLDRIERTIGVGTQPPGAAEAFAAMNAIALRVRDVAQARFDSELSRLQRRVEQVRTALIAFTVATVVAALLAALAFARLVSRPMRQITASIDALGRAELDTRVQVTGPRDLQAIGASLDWLRRRIRDLEAQKSTFVRHMSHELKSPLANIRAGIELLREESGEDADRDEIAAIVERNATRLQRQIDDLLTYAGWQEAQPPHRPEPVALQALVEKAVQDQAFDAMSRGIDVDTALEPVTISADESQIRAIVDNLVGNAIKYSPDDGRVQVALVRRGDHVDIDVRDQGPGIAPELRERVFEPFFRGPEATTTAGTGIGLALAAAAARTHGGFIDILDSDAGAHLRATLPLEAPG